MIGATSPAPRLTARITPVRIPLLACGSTMRNVVWKRVAPRLIAAIAQIVAGTVRSASSVATMTTGSVSTASVSEDQITAG
jgi:hypothetical protein